MCFKEAPPPHPTSIHFTRGPQGLLRSASLLQNACLHRPFLNRLKYQYSLEDLSVGQNRAKIGIPIPDSNTWFQYRSGDAPKPSFPIKTNQKLQNPKNQHQINHRYSRLCLSKKCPRQNRATRPFNPGSSRWLRHRPPRFIVSKPVFWYRCW